VLVIPSSRTESAYLALEEKVVTLELRPGDLVTEKHLADLVGLGRTPVREAIQRLAWEGLIEIIPRYGMRISEIRPEDYKRVMEPRLQLEPILARYAAAYADAVQRQQLAECATRMMNAAKQRDIQAFLTADKEFDKVLEGACPNPYIPKMLGPLQTHARRFWTRFGSNSGPERSAAMHVKVMQAIASRDESEAENDMRALMEYLGDVANSISR
jgi:DNA-binding GntR family transcriptional regulator